MTVKKVTFDVAGLYSSRRMGHGHLSSESYVIVMNTAMRGALLGQMIAQRGIDFAKEHYKSLMNLKLMPQYPEKYVQDQLLVNLITNKGLTSKGKVKKSEDVDGLRTVGIRGVAALDQLVVYVQGELEGLEDFLKGIQYLGDSESLVGLASIEEAETLENVLLPYNMDKGFDVQIQELWDWSPKSTFDQNYAYSSKRRNKYVGMVCYVEECISSEDALKQWETAELIHI